MAGPLDLTEVAQAAAALRSAGKKADAAKGFEVLSRAAREDGQVALAMYAARSAAELGAGASATALVAKIAAAYGAGSKRVDAALRPRPPAPPKKGAAAAAATTEATAVIAKAGEAAAAAEKLGGKLPAVPLIAALAPKNLEQLVGVMRPSVRKAGDVVVDVGQEASALFLIARGTLKVTRADHELGRLRAGAFFGEIALLGGTRRTARVECEDEAWLLEIPRAALETAAAKAPGMADTLAAYARSRLLGNTMRTSEVFRRLAPEERDQLVARFEPKVFDAGKTIIKVGDEGERLHVIVSGEVEIRDGAIVTARLAAGDLFGEMSLLHRKPANADVVAVGRAVTLSLDRPKFDDVAVKHPELLAEVYKTLIQREAANRAAPAPVEIAADDAEEIIL